MNEGIYIVVGIIMSLLIDKITRNNQGMTGPEKVWLTNFANFTGFVIASVVLYILGQPITMDTTLVLFGLTFSSSQVTYWIIKYRPQRWK